MPLPVGLLFRLTAAPDLQCHSLILTLHLQPEFELGGGRGRDQGVRGRPRPWQLQPVTAANITANVRRANTSRRIVMANREKTVCIK